GAPSSPKSDPPPKEFSPARSSLRGCSRRNLNKNFRSVCRRRANFHAPAYLLRSLSHQREAKMTWLRRFLHFEPAAVVFDGKCDFRRLVFERNLDAGGSAVPVSVCHSFLADAGQMVHS